jgi:hypothetical protein
MTLKEELTNIVSEANRISAWHKYNPKETIVDELIKSKVIILPAMPGDILYEIRKVCDTNDGYKEEWKPDPEFSEDCKYFEPASWYDDADECKAVDDIDERDYPCLNLNILCEECKSRFCIQKTKFQWSDMDRVVGTAMYNEDTELYYRKYLTEEAAKETLEEIVK